ncbi:hypothetical protein BsWGS_16655 [Bradybaena similaris]
MKLCVLMLVLCALTICFVPDTQGRPPPNVKPKQKYGPLKKLRFKQLIDWIVSLDDDPTDPDILRQSIATLTLVSGSSVSPLTDMSPMSVCMRACFGNCTSVSVSILHTCNRDCMLNPHRYDHLCNGTGSSSASGSGANRSR